MITYADIERLQTPVADINFTWAIDGVPPKAAVLGFLFQCVNFLSNNETRASIKQRFVDNNLGANDNVRIYLGEMKIKDILNALGYFEGYDYKPELYQLRDMIYKLMEINHANH